MNIAQLKSLPAERNLPFESVLLLKKVSVKCARNGNEFITIELGDRTGSLTTTLFNDQPAYLLIRQMREGGVLRVKGRTDYYQDRFSPKVDEVECVPEEEVVNHLDDLIEVSPEDPLKLWGEIKAAIEIIQRPALKATVHHAIMEIEEEFRTAPAAVSMHHAYRFGLLEHTTRMVRVARALLPLYPEVDADLALAGIILHDIGKTGEYSRGLTTRRTQAGILQGHIVLGYRMARRSGMLCKLEPELLERLEHVILSHQGLLEWGAAALAATPEAVFVSLIDNLDAKMGMVQNTLRKAANAEGFSDFLPGLGAPLLLAKPSPLIPESSSEDEEAPEPVEPIAVDSVSDSAAVPQD